MSKIKKNDKIDIIIGLATAIASYEDVCEDGEYSEAVAKELTGMLIESCVIFTMEHIIKEMNSDKASVHMAANADKFINAAIRAASKK